MSDCENTNASVQACTPKSATQATPCQLLQRHLRRFDSVDQARQFRRMDLTLSASIEKFKARNANNTLLHDAAVNDSAERVLQLIRSGSPVDVQNAHGQTPLMLAAQKSYWGPTQEILIGAGSNIYMGQESSALQLLGSRKFVSLRIIRLLYEKLRIDCSNIREKIANSLLKAGWPLPKIIQLRDAAMTEILLQLLLQLGLANNVYIDALENNDLGETALHLAVENFDVDNVKVLLKYNANTNVEDSDGRTPISYLYHRRSTVYSVEKLSILIMLLNRVGRARINARQLCNIFRYGKREVIELLLQRNVNLMSIADDYGRGSCVHVLAENINPGVFELLRNKRFDVNARDIWLHTPLMIAAKSHNVHAIELLLDKGADIDAVNNTGRTALLDIIDGDVCQQLYMECVQTLLESGTNAQTENDGLTVFQVVWIRKNLILGDLVLAHLALKQAQKTRIIQRIHNDIISNNRFADFFRLCQQQMNTKIYEDTTLLHLLNATDNQLIIYGRNEEMVSRIQDHIATLSENYYFRTLLQKRLSKILLRQQAAEAICTIMGITSKQFPHIVDRILGYLDPQDTRNFVDATVSILEIAK